MKHICDDCGRNWNTSLAWEGYCRPIPDAAPTYNEWQECWLCEECMAESRKYRRYNEDEENYKATHRGRNGY